MNIQNMIGLAGVAAMVAGWWFGYYRPRAQSEACGTEIQVCLAVNKMRLKDGKQPLVCPPQGSLWCSPEDTMVLEHFDLPSAAEVGTYAHERGVRFTVGLRLTCPTDVAAITDGLREAVNAGVVDQVTIYPSDDSRCLRSVIGAIERRYGIRPIEQ